MKKRIIYIFLGLLIPISYYGCKQDDVVLRDPQKVLRPWNIAMPIVSLDVAAADLLKNTGTNSTIFFDDEGVINFQIEKNYDVPLNNIVNFSDIAYQENHPLSISKKSVLQQEFFYDTIPVSYTTTQDYDSILVNTANLIITLSDIGAINGTYNISFPGIIFENGVTLKIEGSLGQTSSNAQILNGAIMHLVKNKLGQNCYVAVTELNYNTPTPPPASAQLQFSVEMNDFDAKKVWGYFGTSNVLKIFQEMDLALFQGLDFAEIVELKDIIMKVNVRNYYGIPFQVVFDSIVFKNTIKNKQVILDLGNNDRLNIPPALFDTPIKVISDSMIINKDNSNLVDGVNIGPNNIFYQFLTEMNPDGPVQKNFLVNSDNYRLYIDTKFQIPFWFKTRNYNRTDTINFNIANIVEDSNKLDYFDYLELYFDFENGLPFNISIQGYMATDDGVIVDSIFNCANSESGQCDNIGHKILMNSGDKQNPKITKVDVLLNQDMLKDMHAKKVTQILLNTHFTTGPIDNPDFVKLKDENYLKMKFAFELKSNTIKQN